MRTVEYTEYAMEKEVFFKKHNNDFFVEDLPTTTENTFLKMYSFKDGAEWYEELRKVCEVAEFTVKGLQFKKKVELAETEFWSTETESKCFYERW